MFRHRIQLRRWVARVLLLWLFGVGVGVANACAVAIGVDEGQHAGAVVPVEAVHHGSHAWIHDDGGQEHQRASAQSNCKDFCDKASVSIPPQQSALDDAHGHALPALTATMSVRPVLSFPTVGLPLTIRDGLVPAPLPIQIAFLRLAL